MVDKKDNVNKDYPHATHYYRMDYQPQDPIGAVDNIYVQSRNYCQ